MDDIFLQLSKLTESSPLSSSKSSLFNETYTKEEEELFIYDDLKVPDLNPKRSASGMPVIVVVDDDYPTLDLMKIYLQREYEYVSFDNPKEAIFWLNTHIPDLIFIDCFLTMIPSKKVVEIIRSIKNYADIPIYYLCESEEIKAISDKIPTGVVECVTRPVGRGELQRILDEVFKDKFTPEEEDELDIWEAISQAENLLNSNPS